MKYAAQNGKVFTKKQYEAYLEGVALGIWATAITLEKTDGYSKWNDPLYINSLDDVYSYVFDFHDGGRHHKFESYEDVLKGLMREIQNYKD